jgi:hypothetical protein
VICFLVVDWQDWRLEEGGEKEGGEKEGGEKEGGEKRGW